MKDFYYGKYATLNLILNTSLTEKPNINGNIEDPNFAYNWNYEKWILKNNQILYTGLTTKDPSPSEIMNIVESLSKLDPSLNGVIKLMPEEITEYHYAQTTYVVANGKISELNDDLLLSLIHNKLA